MMIRHRSTDTEPSQLEAADHRQRLFRFSPDLNMGTLIQIGVLVVGMALGYSKIETSIALNVQRTEAIERRSSEQEKRTENTLSEMKSDVKATGVQVQDLKAKIDLLDLKISQPGRK